MVQGSNLFFRFLSSDTHRPFVRLAITCIMDENIRCIVDTARSGMLRR
jgi:hypothetical protein